MQRKILRRSPLSTSFLCHCKVGHMDPFSLYHFIEKEIATLDGVASLHLPSEAVSGIREIALSTPSSGGGSMRIDGRAPSVHFMNDLEEDKEYARWPKTVKALLQPNWPGQLYFVRKNLITAIFVFDPSDEVPDRNARNPNPCPKFVIPTFRWRPACGWR